MDSHIDFKPVSMNGISMKNIHKWRAVFFCCALFYFRSLALSLSLAPNHLYWSLSKTDSMLEDRARSRSVAAATRSVWTNTHVSWSSSATQRSCTAHARNTVRLLDVILIFILTFRKMILEFSYGETTLIVFTENQWTQTMLFTTYTQQLCSG